MGPTISHKEIAASSCFKVLMQKCWGMLYSKTLLSCGGTKHGAKSVIRG